MQPMTLASHQQSEQATVLVVEDDRGVRESLAMVLEYQGYTVSQAVTGEEGLELFHSETPTLVVLDLNLPGIDGVEVCRRLRQQKAPVGILMLTARDQVAERVRGLDAGADDYLAKPFALDELLARVRALLRSSGRRSDAEPSVDVTILRLDDLSVSVESRRVERAGVPIDLTKLEFDLLSMLITNQDLVLTRDQLVEAVWGWENDGGSNSLEVFVSSLRRKTEINGASRLIQTVRGVGYVARAGT